MDGTHRRPAVLRAAAHRVDHQVHRLPGVVLRVGEPASGPAPKFEQLALRRHGVWRRRGWPGTAEFHRVEHEARHVGIAAPGAAQTLREGVPVELPDRLAMRPLTSRAPTLAWRLQPGWQT